MKTGARIISSWCSMAARLRTGDLKRLQDTYRTVRRSVLTVFYGNFPENKGPMDLSSIAVLKPLVWDDGLPLLKPGDLHQITNPNTKELVTGWDIARNTGSYTWEEEEEKRKYFQKLDWKEDPSEVPPGGERP